MKSTILLLAILMLTPLALLHTKRNLAGVPTIGELRGQNFQSLENIAAMTSSDWN